MSKVFVVCRRVTDFDDRDDDFEDVICVCKTYTGAMSVITNFVERSKNYFSSGINGRWIGKEYVIQDSRSHWCLWAAEISFVE